METTRTGVVSDKLIKAEIASKYSIPIKDIDVTTQSRSEYASYSFKKNDGGKYSVISNNNLTDDELFEIIKAILHRDKISFHTLKPKFEYMPGDSMEPMDYGSYNYLGFSFTYI